MRIPANHNPFSAVPVNGQHWPLRLVFHTQAVVQFLGRHYSRLLLALGCVIIAVQTVEHLTFSHADSAFYYAEVLLIVSVLVAVWFLIRVLLTTLAERASAFETLRLKHDVGMYLSTSQDVHDVARRLVEKVAQIAATAHVDLYTYDRHGKDFQWAAECAGPIPVALDDDRPARIDPAACRQCLARQAGHPFILSTCPQQNSPTRQAVNHYCLPLIQGNETISLLRLSTPGRALLPARTLELLTAVTPEVTGALGLAMEKHDREEERVTQKVRAVQLGIARDLHDTLGQNISYLRMRLDYLADGKLQAAPGSPIPDANMELSQMVTVANESYDLVRGTLAVLQLDSSDGLQQLFSRYAAQVACRSGIEITLNEQGKPRPLQVSLVRQLFFIFREALNNVEKHACAANVRIELAWKATSLELAISDDGCGFNALQPPASGHYGLQFVRERVESLRGSFSIQSMPGAGTRLLVQIPWNPEPPVGPPAGPPHLHRLETFNENFNC